jgi:hypothetical protein
MAGKSLIGALRVTLGLDSAEFTKGAAKAKQEVTAMQRGFGALKGAVAGMIGMIGVDLVNDLRALARESIGAVGGLGELAAQIGVSTDALQSLRYAASQTGVSDEELEKSLSQLTRRLGDAAAGAKEPAKAFKALGVDIRDAAGNVRPTEQVLLDVADGLSKIKTPAEQAAIAVDLFGKSGMTMIPMLKEGKKSLEEYMRTAKEIGVVIDEATIANADAVDDQHTANDRVVKMKIDKMFAEQASTMAAIEVRWAQFKVGLLDGLGASMEAIGTVFGAVERNFHAFASTLLTARENVLRWSARIGDAVSGLPARVIGYMQRLVTGVQQWLGTRLNAVFDGVKKKVDAAGQWFYDLYDKVVGHSYIPDMVDEIGQHMRRLDAELVAPTSKATVAAAEQFRALQQEVSSILDRLFPENAERNRFEGELATLNQYFDTLIKRGGNALTVERQRAAAVSALQRAYLGLNRDGPGGVGFDASRIESTIGGKSIEEMSEEIADRAGTALDMTKKRADTMRVQVVDSFAQMVDGSLRELDRFIGGIKSGNWLDIVGGLLSTIDSIAAAMSGGKGTSFGPFTFGNRSGGGTPGFASGGAMRLGGFPGIDRNLLSLNGRPLARVSAGESMEIRPANDGGGMGRGRIDLFVHPSGEFDTRTAATADQRIAVHAPNIQRSAASMAVGQLSRRASYSLDG